MKIMLELSASGACVDHVATLELDKQLDAMAVLAELEPDLLVFSRAVKAAYARAKAARRKKLKSA